MVHFAPIGLLVMQYNMVSDMWYSKTIYLMLRKQKRGKEIDWSPSVSSRNASK
jgi:hypothetical protein